MLFNIILKIFPDTRVPLYSSVHFFFESAITRIFREAKVVVT